MPPGDLVRQLWYKSLLVSFVVLAIASAYSFFVRGDAPLLVASDATAATASVLIGISFALSGFCYYFDFFDARIIYRKYLGVVGFGYALLYIYLLFLLNPDLYLFGFFKNAGSIDFLLGITAMEVFFFMTVISNEWVMRRIGPQNWRRDLRLGYLAYALLVVRVIYLDHATWQWWWKHMEGPPPIRLVITIFAIAVILFRGSMIIAKMGHEQNSVQTPQPAVPTSS